MENDLEQSESYKNISEALLAHAGIITFISMAILMKFGIIPDHIFLIVIAALAGCWGVFELMASKFKILATIGWIFALAWLIFGDRGILRGY